MDGRGRALDNIITERFWRSIKYEEVYLNEYSSPREARTGIKQYIEFYNDTRLHQSLGYQTPFSRLLFINPFYKLVPKDRFVLFPLKVNWIYIC